MAQLTGEFPRTIPRAVWLTARARNAVRRPVFIGAVSIGTFVAALLALILVPPQVRHAGQLASVTVGARPDTAPFVAALSQARLRLATADSSLALARVRTTGAPTPSVDTLSPILTARRDSLSAAVNDLDALLTRAETAPVTASYRALGESPQLASSARVKTLLDSLGGVERDRESFGPTGGADPVYVALVSRAAEIGREIQALGQSRRDTLRQKIAALNAPAQHEAVPVAPAVDTSGWVVERDSAQSLVAEATTALDDARAKGADYVREAARAREEANFNAPPVALLAAALVFGVVLGFGTAFFDELRRPRAGDEHEVERLTGTRVLATIRPRPRNPDRRRRLADRLAPPYFDPGADGYQLTYLHVARTGASRLMLTISGVDTGIAAVVGANVAAIAADEARSTIIIDTDARTSPVAAALRIHAEPGVADILTQYIDWAEVTSQAMVGRDRVIDVLPSGVSSAGLYGSAVTALLRQEATRLVRHYEAIIVVAPIEHAAAGVPSALPIADTILCARVGHTRIARLQAALDSLRAAGGNAVGIVLWDSIPPALATPESIARAPRPIRTAEMQSLTSAR
jgi:Mrp family chromosome partitioning ATPase